MSAIVPFVALAALIALSLGARRAARVTARSGRQLAVAALSSGVLMSLLLFS